jgi:hypothetical protein
VSAFLIQHFFDTASRFSLYWSLHLYIFSKHFFVEYLQFSLRPVKRLRLRMILLRRLVWRTATTMVFTQWRLEKKKKVYFILRAIRLRIYIYIYKYIKIHDGRESGSNSKASSCNIIRIYAYFRLLFRSIGKGESKTHPSKAQFSYSLIVF